MIGHRIRGEGGLWLSNTYVRLVGSTVVSNFPSHIRYKYRKSGAIAKLQISRSTISVMNLSVRFHPSESSLQSRNIVRVQTAHLTGTFPPCTIWISVSARLA
jgi:hypothetical protein